MRPQYVFSLLAVAGTVALFWRPAPPRPVTRTQEEAGLEVRITKQAPPHRFEELPAPSLVAPDPRAFNLSRSYLRTRLCAGDEAMVAAVQARLLLTPGEGREFAELLSSCAPASPLCATAVSALEAADAGLTADELSFFAGALVGCDRRRFAELRMDLRLPLALRERAWTFLLDAGEWSPALEALVNEHLEQYGPEAETVEHFRLARLISEVRSESPSLLDASVQLMERSVAVARLLRGAQSEPVRLAACERIGCDAGTSDKVDSGLDPREELAACALQGEEDERGFCLDRLVDLDWAMARVVAQRTHDTSSSWGGSLRAFETRQAFSGFARAFSPTSAPDGGFDPASLLGEFSPESKAPLYSDDGLGNDELAAQWASLAPELASAFFFESSDELGGLRLSGRIGADLFEVTVRRKRESLDARAVLALLNVMVTESRSSRRFFYVESPWVPAARFAEPSQVAKLIELGIIELADPDKVRERFD